jgi:hypothetical protein
MCIDSMNHFRTARPYFASGAACSDPSTRAVHDPVVITGPVTNDELALRSSIGLFLFVPPGVTEQFSRAPAFAWSAAGCHRQRPVSGRWHRTRQRSAQLIRSKAKIASAAAAILRGVHRLTSERRLSRIVYLVENRCDLLCFRIAGIQRYETEATNDGCASVPFSSNPRRGNFRGSARRSFLLHPRARST